MPAFSRLPLSSPQEPDASVQQNAHAHQDPQLWAQQKEEWLNSQALQLRGITNPNAIQLAEFSIVNTRVVIHNIAQIAMQDPSIASELPALDRLQEKIMGLHPDGHPLGMHYRLRLYMAAAVFFRDNSPDLPQTAFELGNAINQMDRLFGSNPRMAVDLFSFFNPRGAQTVRAFNEILSQISNSENPPKALSSFCRMVQSPGYRSSLLADISQVVEGQPDQLSAILSFYLCPSVQNRTGSDQRAAQINRIAHALSRYGLWDRISPGPS